MYYKKMKKHLCFKNEIITVSAKVANNESICLGFVSSFYCNKSNLLQNSFISFITLILTLQLYNSLSYRMTKYKYKY
jgi:hypothetical protein